MSLPYMPARKVGDWLFVSGQIAKRPDGTFPEGIAAQTEQALENLAYVVESYAYEIGDVVKTTVFLADMDDFAAMNQVYGAFFVEPYPARSTVAVKELPRVADTPLLVEIEAVACKDGA